MVRPREKESETREECTVESKEIQKTCSKDIHKLGRRRERKKSGSTRNSNHTPEKVPGPEDQCDEKRNASRGYRESTRAGTHDIAKKKKRERV